MVAGFLGDVQRQNWSLPSDCHPAPVVERVHWKKYWFRSNQPVVELTGRMDPPWKDHFTCRMDQRYIHQRSLAAVGCFQRL